MNAFGDLQAMFQAALKRVDPYRMLVDHVRLEADTLVVAFDGHHHAVDLTDFDEIVVLGAGKASARMARAIEDILGPRLSGGVVVTKYGHAEKLDRVQVVESGHPTPDANSVAGAIKVADLAASAQSRTLVLNLISGGGSALCCAPVPPLTLADKQAVTRALLASGADIGEINCLRKHLSTLKGGRLLRLLAPAKSLNLILSDVVGDDLATIASGMTTADPTTFTDARGIIDKYRLRDQIPATALDVLMTGANETLKPGDPALDFATNILIGTNLAAVLAAMETARDRGYHTVALTASITGEAREMAKMLFGIARDVRRSGLLVAKPALVIAGGETTVTLAGSGKGGRNQEMALAFLAELAKDPEGGRGISFLSASTDGSDGPTDAAGAFASAEVLGMARAAGLSINAYLANNDSYHFFEKTGHLLKTGPTMTNVCDLHMVVVA